MKKPLPYPRIPDNAVAPVIRTIADYYAFRNRCRRRIERLTGQPPVIPDEQGLPNHRRRFRASAGQG